MRGLVPRWQTLLSGISSYVNIGPKMSSLKIIPQEGTTYQMHVLLYLQEGLVAIVIKMSKIVFNILSSKTCCHLSI